MSLNDHKALYILDIYTTHSIPLWSHNHHKSNSQQYWRVATSYYHQGGTSCQSQSKLSRGLWVLWVNTPVLWRVLSHTTTLPSCKTRQDMADPQGYRNRLLLAATVCTDTATFNATRSGNSPVNFCHLAVHYSNPWSQWGLSMICLIVAMLCREKLLSKRVWSQLSRQAMWWY